MDSIQAVLLKETRAESSRGRFWLRPVFVAAEPALGYGFLQPPTVLSLNPG